MQNQAAQPRNRFEQLLLDIARRLPPEKLDSLLEFAEFLEYRTGQAEYEASEARWDELLARPEAQRLMERMAREAQADYDAGKTSPLEFDEHGNLTSRA